MPALSRVLASALCAPCLALSLAAPARADCEPSVQAREASARAAFERDDLAEATAALRGAIACEDRPALLYDLYVVLERAGEWDAAADALESYLEHDDTEIDDEARRDLEGWVLELRSRAHPEPEPERALDLHGDEGWQIASAVVLGAGLLSLAAFAVSGSLALSFRAQHTRCEGVPDCEARHDRTASTLELATWTTLGVGGGMTILGVVFVVVTGLGSGGAASSLPRSLDPSFQMWQPLSLRVGPASLSIEGRF